MTTADFDQSEVLTQLAAALDVDADRLAELFDTIMPFEVIADEARFAASLDGKPCSLDYLIDAARLVLAADLADLEDELLDRRQ